MCETKMEWTEVHCVHYLRILYLSSRKAATDSYFNAVVILLHKNALSHLYFLNRMIFTLIFYNIVI